MVSFRIRGIKDADLPAELSDAAKYYHVISWSEVTRLLWNSMKQSLKKGYLMGINITPAR